MPEIILVTGGNRSGKSTYAENLLHGRDDVLYIATAIRTDEEMVERIRHHRERRNQSWSTFEGFQDLDRAIETHSGSHVLLDCVTNMVSNLIFSQSGDPETMGQADQERLLEQIKEEFDKLLSSTRARGKSIVLVTNEVGMGLISEYPLGRLFVDFSGFINQYLAREADRVYFMVSGLPLTLKG